MIDCFSGQSNDVIQPMDALNILLLKHVEYEHDFKRNMKHFIALHRAIEHDHASPFVISWLTDIYPEVK